MKRTKLILAIIGTILFNLLFWHETIGLNALIFTAFIIGISFYLFPESRTSNKALIVATGTLITAGTIVYHASELAIFIWIFSIVLLQPFIHYKKLQTIFYSTLSAISSFFMSWQLIGQNIVLRKKTNFKLNTLLKYLKLTLLPILVVYIFYWIFKFANPVFDKLSDTFFINIADWFVHIFQNVSFLQILFTFWGFVMLAWYIYKNKTDYVIYDEAKYPENIIRKRKKQSFNKYWFGSIGLKPLLKNEFRIALMMIALVNILLLIINIIDISTIWFNFKYTADTDLKQFVHEGTYLLILSIFLSIGIMIYFFRKNLNFFKDKKAVQVLSYIWIAQNVILLVSVIIRNMHYINHFGLAYKRIGVFFFLVLVIYGLYSLFLKIKGVKSSFWLFKINTWAVYIGFVLFAVPDWDIIIAKHNLAHPLRNNIETSFLLTFDDKALPYIDQRKDILMQSEDFNTYRVFYDSYQNVYKGRVKSFVSTYSQRSWLSWNYADAKANQYFINKSKN